MSLHNRYPSYFYKPGNLFNTYLGYNSDQGSSAANAQGRNAGDSTKVRTRRSGARRSHREAVAGALLARFAKEHLSLSETERLLQLIAEDVGVHREQRRDLSLRRSTELGEFVRDHIPAERAEIYLSTLKERLRLGERLIQK
jgi:hypothetical protein